MNARQRVAIPAAPGMGPGMAMTGGFDPSSLMAAPTIKTGCDHESGKHGKQSILRSQ